MQSLSFRDRNVVIREFYTHNFDKGKNFTVKHFVENYGLKKRTVQRILKRIEDDPSENGVARAEGSGRPRLLNPRQEMAVLTSLENRRGPSTRRVAGRYGVSQRTIQRTLHRQDATCPKRKAAPDISPEQLVRVQERCQELSTRYFPAGGRVAIVIDDESYFTLKNDHVR